MNIMAEAKQRKFFCHRYLKVISNEILDPGYWKDKREMDAGGY